MNGCDLLVCCASAYGTEADFSIKKACGLTLNILELFESEITKVVAGKLQTVPDLYYTCPYDTGKDQAVPCNALNVVAYKVMWIIDALPVIAWHRRGKDENQEPTMAALPYAKLREKLASLVLEALDSARKQLKSVVDPADKASKPVERGGELCERSGARRKDSAKPDDVQVASMKKELSNYFGGMKTFSMLLKIEEECQGKANLIGRLIDEKDSAANEALKVCKVMADPTLSLAYIATRLAKPEDVIQPEVTSVSSQPKRGVCCNIL